MDQQVLRITELNQQELIALTIMQYDFTATCEYVQENDIWCETLASTFT